MPGKDDGFFDPLFDLDGDGNTDVFEEAAGFMMLDELMNEEQDEADEADEEDEPDPLFDRVTAYAPQKARKPAPAARETPHEEPEAAEPAGDPFEEYVKCRKNYRLKTLLTVLFTAFFLLAIYFVARICMKGSGLYGSIGAVVFAIAAAAGLSFPLISSISAQSIAKAKYKTARKRWERFCGTDEDR